MKINKWIEKNITVNLKDKNVFITGGNSGIGLSIAKRCVKLNANVTILSRSVEKCEKAKSDLLRLNPNALVNIIKIDLEDLSSVDFAVEKIKEKDVDFFINNAGVYHIPKSKTANGFEKVIGTNFLGTVYLNELLREYFLTLPHPVKVVFTSSISGNFVKPDLEDFYSEKKYKPIKVYALSKRYINDYFTYATNLAKGTNLSYLLSHPGVTYSPLIQKGYNKFFAFISKIFMKIFFHSTEKASLSPLYALKHENGTTVGPKLFGIRGFPKKTKLKFDENYIDVVNKGLKELNNARK